MLSRALPLLLGPLLAGCVVVEEPFTTELDATGVTLLRGDIERGSVDYNGSSTLDGFEVYGVSRGSGSSQTRAQRKEEGNSWVLEVDDDVLEVRADSRESGTVRFDIDGPTLMDTDIVVESGSVHIEDVVGNHYITAGRITAEQITGNVDLYSRTGGVRAEIEDPWTDVRIDSRGGGVDLYLPYGLDYDIEVWGDPEYSMNVEDLGFYDEYMGEGYFAAESGHADVRVTVKVIGGSFELYEAY